jgi:hypothetical protein
MGCYMVVLLRTQFFPGTYFEIHTWFLLEFVIDRDGSHKKRQMQFRVDLILDS